MEQRLRPVWRSVMAIPGKRVLRKWWVRAVAQKALSVAPGGRGVYDAGQLRLTGTTGFNPARLEAKLRQTLDGLRLAKITDVPPSVLEVGTGWFPVPALAFWLAGSERVVTTDVTALADPSKFAQSADFLSSPQTQTILGEYDVASLPDRLALVRELTMLDSAGTSAAVERLRDAGFAYDVSDRWHTHLADSFDFVFSNNVFEHIDRPTLLDISSRLRAHTRDGGRGFHFIDLTDHFAHSDKSIDTLHFLRFSRRQWRLFNSSIHFQNRLRLPDYLSLLQEAGFTIETYDVGRPPSEVIDSAKIHSDFGHLSRDEATVTRLSVVVGRHGVD